jgi:general secretion pathway protein L
MSSLIVLLPSSDVLGPGGWVQAPMSFALFGRKNEVRDIGQAPFEALPVADTTVLVVAARDTLLLNAKLPPVTGPRLLRVLPNVVEEYLIQDSQACHIAIDPAVLDSGERCLAVLDRTWFASVIERFARAGHRRLRAVPLVHCIPVPEASAQQQSATASNELPQAGATIADALQGALPRTGGEAVTSDLTSNLAGELAPGVGAAGDPAKDAVDGAGLAAPQTMASVLIVRRDRVDEANAHDHKNCWVELALRQGALGFGLSVNAAQLDATLAELAQRLPLTVYSLDSAAGTEPGVAHMVGQTVEHGVERGVEPAGHADIGAGESLLMQTSPAWRERGVSLATVASDALVCRFDLCQFEFSNAGRNRLGAGGFKPWRAALAFVGASLLISIVALNVQWLQLRHRRDTINAQMAVLVKAAFPDTRVILDPHAQMASELTRLSDRMGELHAKDFLALSGDLAQALGPISSASIAELNYSGGALDVTFKPGTDIDEDGLKRRLEAHGLSVQEDSGKWTLKPTQSRPR